MDFWRAPQTFAPGAAPPVTAAENLVQLTGPSNRPS
jgi:hypothetical protein